MNAADLLLSGRVLSGREAETIGLARCLAGEDFLAGVEAYARDLAQNCSPRSMMIIKRQLRQAWSQSLAHATALSTRETSRCIGSEDVAEGIAHFLERRHARFPSLA
jgi:enoyl-CoA hydratase/carnithine racemase